VIEFLEKTIHYSNNLSPEKRLNEKKNKPTQATSRSQTAMTQFRQESKWA
jgi:hypothetical protein